MYALTAQPRSHAALCVHRRSDALAEQLSELAAQEEGREGQSGGLSEEAAAQVSPVHAVYMTCPVRAPRCPDACSLGGQMSVR